MRYLCALLLNALTSRQSRLKAVFAAERDRVNESPHTCRFGQAERRQVRRDLAGACDPRSSSSSDSSHTFIGQSGDGADRGALYPTRSKASAKSGCEFARSGAISCKRLLSLSVIVAMNRISLNIPPLEAEWFRLWHGNGAVITILESVSLQVDSIVCNVSLTPSSSGGRQVPSISGCNGPCAAVFVPRYLFSISTGVKLAPPL